MNNPHQQPSKESMKTSVKIQETHLESKKNEELQKFSASCKLDEDEEKEEEKNREGERSLQNFFSLLTSHWSIYKEKNKVKDNFLLWEKLLISPPTSTIHPY